MPATLSTQAPTGSTYQPPKGLAPGTAAGEPQSMTGPGAMFMVVLAFAGFGVYQLVTSKK